MSKKHLSRNPKDIKVKDNKGDAWFYEEGRGLEIIVKDIHGDFFHILIPWRTIVASVKRYQQKDEK